MIAEAQNVLLFAPVSEQKQGKSGSLCVTNFKLTFVTTEERSKEVNSLHLQLFHLFVSVIESPLLVFYTSVQYEECCMGTLCVLHFSTLEAFVIC